MTTTDRDQLADTLDIALNQIGAPIDDAGLWKLTDALLAAGATLPRRIETTEQLDALPIGSVVIEGDDGRPQPWVFELQVMPGVFHRFPQGWHVVAGYGPRTPELPALVLWTPGGAQ